jgi:N-acetylglucosamine kinase-like BadF-type ATPase
MILIADSGSTKTDWRAIGHQMPTRQYHTPGMNPYYQTLPELVKTLQEGLLPQVEEAPSSVYFYGAGCTEGEAQNTMAHAIRQVFPHTEVTVAGDMLAAARATCGHQEGIACILGTGANSGYYNGQSLIARVPPLGFILGDEGSGAYFGKQLVTAYLRKRMPENLATYFQKRYPMDETAFLQHIYREPYPNRFLAGFTKFMFHHLHDPFIARMIAEGFRTFFREHIAHYAGYKLVPVHVVGSVGFYFSTILRQEAADMGIRIQHILETPISGLTLYHQQLAGIARS